jgi:hypothetical protein
MRIHEKEQHASHEFARCHVVLGHAWISSNLQNVISWFYLAHLQLPVLCELRSWRRFKIPMNIE